jgi:hypothetical protein
MSGDFADFSKQCLYCIDLKSVNPFRIKKLIFRKNTNGIISVSLTSGNAGWFSSGILHHVVR